MTRTCTYTVKFLCLGEQIWSHEAYSSRAICSLAIELLPGEAKLSTVD